MILQAIYVSINQGKLKFIHNINHTIIAILKSHPHIHAHLETSICKKKKINIANTHTSPFNIATSDKSNQVCNLNRYNKNIEITKSIISTISCNSFNIIV